MQWNDWMQSWKIKTVKFSTVAVTAITSYFYLHYTPLMLINYCVNKLILLLLLATKIAAGKLKEETVFSYTVLKTNWISAHSFSRCAMTVCDTGMIQASNYEAGAWKHWRLLARGTHILVFLWGASSLHRVCMITHSSRFLNILPPVREESSLGEVCGSKDPNHLTFTFEWPLLTTSNFNVDIWTTWVTLLQAFTATVIP